MTSNWYGEKNIQEDHVEDRCILAQSFILGVMVARYSSCIVRYAVFEKDKRKQSDAAMWRIWIIVYQKKPHLHFFPYRRIIFSDLEIREHVALWLNSLQDPCGPARERRHPAKALFNDHIRLHIVISEKSSLIQGHSSYFLCLQSALFIFRKSSVNWANGFEVYTGFKEV